MDWYKCTWFATSLTAPLRVMFRVKKKECSVVRESGASAGINAPECCEKCRSRCSPPQRVVETKSYSYVSSACGKDTCQYVSTYFSNSTSAHGTTTAERRHTGLVS